MKIRDLFEESLPSDFDSIVELIIRDCKPFISEYTTGLLYRGMRNKDQEIMKVKTREDRKPKNMDAIVHDKMDAWFNEKFKFKARSAAAFVVGNFAEARSYGQVYAVFPIGDFKFAWSPKVSDLFIQVSEDGDIEGQLENFNYRDTDLNAAINSKNEIMLSCKEYYAVRVRSQDEGQLYLDSIQGN